MGEVITWTIGELTDWLDAVVARSLGGEIWVEGEILNLTRSTNGHVYFTLVERTDRAGAPPSLNVALFDWHRTNVNHLLKRSGGAVRMADGVRVRVRGDVRLYPARSQYQLRMTTIDPAFTLGNLAAERAALLARLEGEGLLARNRSLPLVALPLRIALVTSAGSAACADALHELETAGFGFEVLVVDSRVQGTEAPDDLVRALGRAAAWGPDLIAVVRGGGARTDLAAFDDERVARAIATCEVPVWCGLGHETDRAVADEVAHRSWKTPTACADAVVELPAAAAAAVDAAWAATAAAARRHLERADHGLHQRTSAVALRAGTGVERADHRLTTAASRLGDRATARVTAVGHRLDAAGATVRSTTARRLDRAVKDLDDRGRLVRAHDPHRTLARGWSITRTAEGRLVRGPDDAPTGTDLVTRLADGEVRSTVTGP